MAVFTSLNSKKWRCEICPAQTFQKLSVALRHEASATHVRAVRRKDAIDIVPDIQLHTQAARDVSFDPSAVTVPGGMHSKAILPEPDVNVTFPHPEPFLTELCDELYESMTAADQHMSRTHLDSIHGPAVEDDDPEQIYDNWSGVLGATASAEDLDALADREDSLRDPSTGSESFATESGIQHEPDFGLGLDFAAFQKALGE